MNSAPWSRNGATTARHPKTGRLYTEMVFQPMLEVLSFLRSSGFKTYIVSGGGSEFMRPWTERVYGIPPEQVIGSRGKLKYEVVDGKTVLRKLPDIDLIDDGAGKPVGIQQLIGRRPIAAFGNSDGDFEMLEWTTSGTGPRFALIVHHTDADREWAYDRDSHIGHLARGSGRGTKTRLDNSRHEAGLESHLSVPAVASRALSGRGGSDASAFTYFLRRRRRAVRRFRRVRFDRTSVFDRHGGGCQHSNLPGAGTGCRFQPHAGGKPSLSNRDFGEPGVGHGDRCQGSRSSPAVARSRTS